MIVKFIILYEMSGNIHFHLLILCSIILQGITDTLSDNDIKKSSNVLVRKKRVFHYEETGGSVRKIEDFPYLVNIRQHGQNNCAGTILSHYCVLTAATCVSFHLSAYQVESGSGYTHRRKVHNVTSKATYYGNPPYDHYDGIALLTIDLPFQFSQRTEPLSLHVDVVPLTEGTPAIVSGWGSWHPILPLKRVQRKLRSITLPIMNNTVCRDIYRGYFAITKKHICTYDAQKSCAHTDEGAPLVVDNKLVGVYVWKGEALGKRNPDVFVNIQNFEYRQWIIRNTILM